MSALVVLPSEGASIGPLGRIKLPGDATHEHFSLVEHPIPPHALMAPLHAHTREDEYSFVLEGVVTLQMGDEVIRATEGTLVLKPRGIPHSFWNETDAPARLLEIISPAGFEKYFQELALLLGHGGVPDAVKLAALYEKYELKMDTQSIEMLSEKYHVRLPGPPPAV